MKRWICAAFALVAIVLSPLSAFADGALYLARGTAAPGVHVALRASDRDAVDRFHAEGLKAGGRDHGRPGLRADYGPTYYAAFLLLPGCWLLLKRFKGFAGNPSGRSVSSAAWRFSAGASPASRRTSMSRF